VDTFTGHGPTKGDKSPPVRSIHALEEGDELGCRLGLGAGEVESARFAPVAGHHEGAVVDATVGAEALGQTSSPGALFAGGLLARCRNYFGESSEGPETVRAEQSGTHQDVLVREGQQGAAVLVAHHGPEHGVGPGGAVDCGESDEQRRGAPDPLEGGE